MSQSSPMSRPSSTSGNSDIVEVGMQIEDYVAGYDDPEADMILRSTDGHLFRVHSYHLKTASAYFRSLSLPINLQRHHTPIVDIEGRKSALKKLLDQITLARPPIIKSWRAAEAIAELGERYQLDHLPWVMAQNMQPCMDKNPVEVFIFASNHDLECLAKAAIASFNNDENFDGLKIRTFRQAWLVGAKAEYIVALFVSMRSTEGKNEVIDWQEVANAFRIYKDSD